MNLVGTFIFYELNVKLRIDSADPTDCEGTGTFFLGEMEIGVSLSFHFDKLGGPGTTLEIHGWNNENPNQYVAAAGFTNNDGEINLAGGVATLDNLISFSGKFIRPDYE